MTKKKIKIRFKKDIKTIHFPLMSPSKLLDEFAFHVRRLEEFYDLPKRSSTMLTIEKSHDPKYPFGPLVHISIKK